ncbi:hypothetical protein G3I60_05005 [Streptomyces sp. SID13666]|uniref:hypothetical protein n=1 Tax=Streptomyces sp. SID13666 TaxID=2706054 RepID=UPI0013C1CF30|nr:hypothetical protein [Streptomyces sp. SID13666]NEA53528.1 hypothetical protein [Streptomyces sp. SID13666]
MPAVPAPAAARYQPVTPDEAVPVANLLPVRAGQAWTITPCRAPWTTWPAARLQQGARELILACGHSGADVAWQVPGVDAYGPHLRLGRASIPGIAREVLRVVLPVLDDQLAARAPDDGPGAHRHRLTELNELGAELREHGAVTFHQAGIAPNSDVLSWTGHGHGIRYAVTLRGTNPAADLAVSGPLSAVERLLPHFLDAAPAQAPRVQLTGVTGRMARRLTARLRPLTGVEQLDTGGLAIGAATGPYGYIAPPADPAARVRDNTPVAAELHSVGIDHLLTLSTTLAR